MTFIPTHLSQLSLRIEQARSEFALPAGAREFVEEGGLDCGDKAALARWLSGDDELAERLLRWCNSPLYNRAQPFRTLDEACLIVDSSELARLALLACVRGMFLPDLMIDQYCRETLWAHSIAVGVVASMISRTSGQGDPSMILVAGALHDVGLLASESLDPDAFADVIALVDELSPVDEIERERFGWDHSELGEAVLNQWGLPETVTMVARYHHQPDHVLCGPDGSTVGCVAIANYLCSRAGWTAAGRHYLAAPSNQVFSRLGIDASLLRVLWQRLYPILEWVGDLR